MDDNEQRQLLLENIEAREKAQEVLQLAEEEISKLGSKGKERFWECVREAADKHLPSVKAPEPMTDKECRRFGDEEMKFGQYVGKRIDEVPLDYLEWLADTELRHSRALTRYLQAQRTRKETG